MIRNKIQKPEGLPKDGRKMVLMFENKNHREEMLLIEVEILKNQNVKITNLVPGTELNLRGIAELLVRIAGEDERLQKPENKTMHYSTPEESLIEAVAFCEKRTIKDWGILEIELERYYKNMQIKNSFTCHLSMLPYFSGKNYYCLYDVVSEVIPLKEVQSDEPFYDNIVPLVTD